MGESLGELDPSSITGQQQPRGKSKPRYNAKEYEGGLENSEDLGELNPIQDSREDPIPKKKKIGAQSKNKVFISGDSFGNPLNRSSGGERVAKEKRKAERHQIAEDFLENEEDVYESGELNPDMF